MNVRINELQTNAKKNNFRDLYSKFALEYNIRGKRGGLEIKW
jgi:hypothetical protein